MGRWSLVEVRLSQPGDYDCGILWSPCSLLSQSLYMTQVYPSSELIITLEILGLSSSRGVATCTHGTHVRTRLHTGSSPIFAILREMKEKRGKQRKKERKKHIHFDSSGGFRCPRCASSYDQIRKVSDKLDKLFALQNIAKLWGIGFTLVFGFKIYRDLTKSATFQFGFMCCICLNQGSFEKVVHKTDI